MLDENALAGLPGTPLLDAAGEEVGPIDDVFAFTATDVPAWVAVRVDGARRLVPLERAELTDDRVRAGFDRATIVSAPQATDDALRPSRELYDHFGLSDASLRDDTGLPATDRHTPSAGTSRPHGCGGADDAEVGRS